MNIIEINNLTKYYGKHRGIIDLSISVEKGSIYGFIGSNGAGKSTTIRSMLGLIIPSSGSINIFGKDVSQSKTDILKDIGYMPSEAMFYENMKVMDVINYSAKLFKKDCSDKAKELCQKLEVDTTKKINELSLGNRKKVSIICAMQHEPKLYILDEPTSGLDPLMQKEFFTLLKEENDKGATIFLSSHVLSEIQKYCHYTAVVRNGKLITSGTVEELMDTNVKKIILKGVQSIDNELTGLSNIQNVENGISFFYNGDVKKIIDVINNMPVTDVTIMEPELEEVFMHFYNE